MASKEVVRASALVWLKNNTTFNTDIETLPPNVELFIEKYESLMTMRPEIASESISGLSQSYNVSDISALLKQYARELVGEEFMPSDVKALPAIDRWVY